MIKRPLSASLIPPQPSQLLAASDTVTEFRRHLCLAFSLVALYVQYLHSLYQIIRTVKKLKKKLLSAKTIISLFPSESVFKVNNCEYCNLKSAGCYLIINNDVAD